MSRVFIGIGSNEGDRLYLISQALRALGGRGDVRLVQMAMVAETEPLGPPQEAYLNTAVEVDTALAPRALLERLKALERQLGRGPSLERWGPRPIDLDILLYDERIIQEPDLRIPHPHLHERSFVLEPLAQLAPDLIHPLLHRSIAALREDQRASATEAVLSPAPDSGEYAPPQAGRRKGKQTVPLRDHPLSLPPSGCA